jgi:HAD superfamily hydrolase (TIGR01493 family)
MEPWPDAAVIAALPLPYAFVTNCSVTLARQAAGRSGLQPRFTLSAEEVGWYKPAAETYREACRRLGSPPELTLFVAGAPYDAVGARKAGLKARLVVRRPDQEVGDPNIPRATSLGPIVSGVE